MCAVSVYVKNAARSGSAWVGAGVRYGSCERVASYTSEDRVSSENLPLP
jgi:hypothetical protein